MSQVNITLNTNTVDVNTTNNQVVVTDLNNSTVVNIDQPITSIVEVISAGPQGPPGPNVFPFTGSGIISGSLTVTGSIEATQGITGSFTGSFTGDGSGLFDIPASGIVGLNLSQIASGSVSASISPDTGLQVNTNVTATSFTGSLFGTSSYATVSNTTTAVSGTLNYISKFTSDNTIGTSSILDTGTQVQVGTFNLGVASTTLNLAITGSTRFSAERNAFVEISTNASNVPIINGYGNGVQISTSDSYGNSNGRILLQPQSNSNIINTVLGTGVIIFNTSGNSERMRITDTGNVTIGATTAGARLDVRAQGALSTDIALRVRNSADTTDILTVTGNENVGIGTASPATKLHVVGSLVAGASTTSGFFYNTANDTLTMSGLRVVEKSAASLLFGNNNTTLTLRTNSLARLYITNNGEVGIGTTTPTAKLHIAAQGALSTDIAFRVRNSADTADLFVVKGGGADKVVVMPSAVIASIDISSTIIQVGSGNSIKFVAPLGFCFSSNYSSPDSSAQLDIVSTTRGFLPPRMTNAQRLAIASPAIGLIVYCTDAVEGLWENTSTGWTNVITSNGAQTITGSLEVTNGITGSLLGTSSWAENAQTASFLNTLNQDLTFNGNLTLNGTASITTLVVNETQYSSGSNQLGDGIEDTQTLFGTVLIPTGSLTVTGSISSTSLTGSDSRIVVADPQGTLQPTTQTIIQAYLDPNGSQVGLLNNTSNWDIYGIYTGPQITDTFQGQKHYNTNYFFEAIDDNVWIRLIRG